MTEYISRLAGIEKLSPSQRVELHMGDATLFAALQSLQAPGVAAVVLDSNPMMSQTVLEELENGRPLFGHMESDPQQQRIYYSLFKRVLGDNYWRGFIRDQYAQLWEGAKENLENLHIVEASIQDAVKEVAVPIPFADLVTYHYPSPRFDPRFPAFHLAANVLVPNGTFTVTTENTDVMDTFVSLGGEFVVSSGRKQRGENPFVSAYDFAWGQNGHYEVHIQNKDGRLPSYVQQMQKSLGFRAMSLLGMVQ